MTRPRSSRGRVLFALHEPGYFRMYGSTIVELGRRGWDVLLAFDRPDKRGTAPQVPRGAGPTVRSLGQVPGDTAALAGTLRAGLDYARYLEPAFAKAVYLRRRAEKALPESLGWLKRVPRLPRGAVSAIVAAARGIERLIPANPDVLSFVRAAAPDLIIVSPVVTMSASGIRQTELIKAGRTLGVPVVVGVASWDHLTSKGLVRLVPDALTVWNGSQLREAVELHRIPRSRVITTGAQSLDHWFLPVSPQATEAFRRRLGLRTTQQLVLFVGSSRNMAPGDSEPAFVRRWLAALRASSSAAVRDAFVLVRPHPTNTEGWRSADLGDDAAAIHPREYSGIPLTDDEVETFRQSLLAGAAVVGINTTAMIEAAILERPVLTVRDARFAHSQEETVHFGYLSDPSTGCALAAASLDEHVAQLEAVLRDPSPQVDAARRFTRAFVRPHGAARSATACLCDALESFVPCAPPADRRVGDEALAASGEGRS